MVYASDAGKSVKNIKTPKKDRNRYCLTDDEVLELAKWAVVVSSSSYIHHMGMEGTLRTIQQWYNITQEPEWSFTVLDGNSSKESV